MTIVLGIDQALGTTGWAAIETDGVQGRERVLETGTIVTTPACPDRERQDIIATALEVVAQVVSPELIGLEGTQVQRNPQTAIRLSELRGALQERLRSRGVPIFTVPTATRRKALGIAGVRGYDKLKRAARTAVLERYGLSVTDDESDAIGIALGAVVVQRREARKGAQGKLPLKPGRKTKRGKRLPGNVLAAMTEADRKQL